MDSFIFLVVNVLMCFIEIASCRFTTAPGAAFLYLPLRAYRVPDPEHTLGIVAVDYEASSIQTSLNSLIRNILLAVGVALLFAIAAAVLAAVRMRRNFIKVNDKILEVASDDGDLTKALNITSGDELEVIGNSLNNLLEKTGNTVREIKGGTGSIETKMSNIKSHVSGSAARVVSLMPAKIGRAHV